MTYNYHLPVFAKNLAEYLRENFAERLYTNIKTSKDTLSVTVYVRDPSFNDTLEVGEYISHFVDNKKVKQEFKGNYILDNIHLLCENGKRKDSYLEIPFP